MDVSAEIEKNWKCSYFRSTIKEISKYLWIAQRHRIVPGKLLKSFNAQLRFWVTQSGSSNIPGKFGKEMLTRSSAR